MHELAHIITKSVGHTDEYWDNYRLILKTAIDNGLYEYKNYYEEPVKYCGKKLIVHHILRVVIKLRNNVEYYYYLF